MFPLMKSHNVHNIIVFCVDKVKETLKQTVNVTLTQNSDLYNPFALQKIGHFYQHSKKVYVMGQGDIYKDNVIVAQMSH